MICIIQLHEDMIQAYIWGKDKSLKDIFTRRIEYETIEKEYSSMTTMNDTATKRHGTGSDHIERKRRAKIDHFAQDTLNEFCTTIPSDMISDIEECILFYSHSFDSYVDTYTEILQTNFPTWHITSERSIYPTQKQLRRHLVKEYSNII